MKKDSINQKSLADIIYECMEFLGFGPEIFYSEETSIDFEYTMILVEYLIENSEIFIKQDKDNTIKDCAKRFLDNINEKTSIYQWYNLSYEKLYPWFLGIIFSEEWRESLIRLKDSDKCISQITDFKERIINISELEHFYG